MNKVLWAIQILLAIIFLFSATMKFITPADVLAKQTPFSISFIRFIGICEILGAVGMIVPGLTRIQPALTPIAAVGLVVIMIGAVTVTVKTMGVALAVVPFVTGVLAVIVAWGRWRKSPLPS